MFYPCHPLLSGAFALVIAALLSVPATAQTVRPNTMVVGPQGDAISGVRSCPQGYVAVGYDADDDVLACQLYGQQLVHFRDGPGEARFSQWPSGGDTSAPLRRHGGPMHACGTTGFISGVALPNTFLCAEATTPSRLTPTHFLFRGRSLATTPMPRSYLREDGSRRDVPSCPEGTFLAGMRLDRNIFLCAYRSNCNSSNHCRPGQVCKGYFTANYAVRSICTGVSRGRVSLFDQAGCAGPIRRLVQLNMPFRDGALRINNDAHRSLVLNRVPAGTVLILYEDDRPRPDRDMTTIRVLRDTFSSHCVPRFELLGERYSDGVVEVRYRDRGRPRGLLGEVSRIEHGSTIESAAGLCLNIPAGGPRVQLFACHGGRNQVFRWLHRYDGPGSSDPISPRTGQIAMPDNRCLQVGEKDSETRRAPLIVGECDASEKTLWTRGPNGSFELLDDLCLDVPGGNDVSGQGVQLFPCHGGSNQRWSAAL